MVRHEAEADDGGSGILARVVRHIEARPLATVLGAGHLRAGAGGGSLPPDPGFGGPLPCASSIGRSGE